MKFLSILPIILSLAGCGVGLNIQRSVLRSTGDLGATIYLDEAVSAQSAESVRVELLNIFNGVDKFMDTGSVANLSVDKLVIELNKIIPVKYQNYAEKIASHIEVANVNVDAIGKNNVKRVKAFLKGAITALNDYDSSVHPMD